NTESFKPASKFNHNSSRFPLIGKHKTVDCLKCHRKETINGKEFQEFRGISFSNCTSCHKDPHQNQFGQNCRQCHTEESFLTLSGGQSRFDHNKTNFKLEAKHMTVGCRDCHKGKTTDPLKHDRCTDCHVDYHSGQFTRNGISPDCSQCHTAKGFNYFTYTVSQHSTGLFPLKGSHSATPCLECHKKQEKWSFRGIGTVCSDCHTDIHKNYIQTKYYPAADCRFCHNENRWPDISFDHSKTNYSLTGAHTRQECRACHFRSDQAGVVQQKFSGLPVSCTSCHKDNHYRQFEKNGVTNCNDCHNTETWKASGFDHNKAAFRLDGKHINVPCAECHKPHSEGSVTYITYKIKDFRCESCHL
ncbi:MAG: cytochrome C, partial [Bacteroidales bacterium]